MENLVEVNFVDIEENNELIDLSNKIINKCFEVEKLKNVNLYVNIILTDPKNIKEINKKHRNIDKETDVLSFPMYEKEEIDNIIVSGKKSFPQIREVLGDIIISIDRVKNQAKEYGHSFEREFSYMIVHGFYHIIGYDHMEEDEKKEMREKEENVLNKLNIKRDMI